MLEERKRAGFQRRTWKQTNTETFRGMLSLNLLWYFCQKDPIFCDFPAVRLYQSLHLPGVTWRRDKGKRIFRDYTVPTLLLRWNYFGEGKARIFLQLSFTILVPVHTAEQGSGDGGGCSSPTVLLRGELNLVCWVSGCVQWLHFFPQETI